MVDPLIYPKDSLNKNIIPALILLSDSIEVLGSPVEDNVKIFQSIRLADLAIITNPGHNWADLFTDSTLELLLRHS